MLTNDRKVAFVGQPPKKTKNLPKLKVTKINMDQKILKIYRNLVKETFNKPKVYQHTFVKPKLIGRNEKPINFDSFDYFEMFDLELGSFSKFSQYFFMMNLFIYLFPVVSP
jgi:hypothetical protein